MNQSAFQFLPSIRSARRSALLFILATLLAFAQLLDAAGRASAATPARETAAAATPVTSNLIIGPGDLGSGFPPPPLLNIYDVEIPSGQLDADGHLVMTKLPRGGLYAATEAQQASLKNMERDAINAVVSLHGLPADDYAAVQSWGRNEALAQLYALLMTAIDASPRSADQQNAVDWMAAVAKRQAIAAAEAAGNEYVSWAGLPRDTWLTLRGSATTTESQFASFLSGNPQNYNNPNTAAADGGYCVYHAPAPYDSEYTGRNHPTCFAPCSSIFGCNPPTPTYDSFVKWGQASASYASLNSVAFARTAQHIAMASGIATAVGVAAGLTAVVPAVAISPVGMSAAVALVVASAAEEGVTLVGTVITPFLGTVSAVAAAASVAAIVLVAVTIAVVQGINVVNATKLPGQIAELINDARTTAQDPKTLKSTTSGQTSLFSLFVGASMPAPTNDSCDNDPLAPPPGITIQNGFLLNLKAAPCLNPTAIHQASPDDPKFLVQEQNAALPTVTQTLSWKDASTDAASTATFSGNWFVIDSAGARRQSLQFDYTDWDGNEQSAWLLQDQITGNYVFVSYDVAGVDDTADLSDSASDTIKYVGSDGKKYSAKVKVQALPTGSPKATTKAIEGQPVTVNANDFKPGDAVDPVTYKWRFETESCHVGWNTCLVVVGRGPSFGDYVDGATVDHTWQAAGAFLAELTATDATGASATTQMIVNVANEKPLLSALDSNAATAAVKVDQDVSISAHFDDPGNLSAFAVSIDWGDGTVEPTRCISQLFGVCPLILFGDGGVIVLSKSQATIGGTTLDFKLDATHHYAVGTYRMKVSVSDHLGATVSRTLDVHVEKYAQPINFLGHSNQTYGDGATTVLAAPLTLNENLTFAVTGDPSVCSITGQGRHPIFDGFFADVAILGAGECKIAASQPASDLFDPGLAVRSFTVNPAPLTVAASDATKVYGAASPAITPSYTGFVDGDDPSDLDTPPICTIDAPSNASAGTYDTVCSGGADNNYGFTYESGTLTVEKAPSAIALIASSAASVRGQSFIVTAAPAASDSTRASYTGTVEFKADGVTIAGCEAQPLAMVAIMGFPVATCDTSGLAVGSHEITADYSGDANHLAGTTASPIGRVVNKAGTTTATSAIGPTTKGKAATFTATIGVVAPGAGTPTGSVTFLDGSTQIGSGTLGVVDGKVVASFTTSALAIGRHTITAKYAGDADFNGSASAAITHYVNTDLSRFPKLASGAWNLAGANLKGAYLVGTSLAGADLTGANLMNAVLIGADLTGAKVAQVTAIGTNLTDAKLAGDAVTGGTWKGATFKTANLAGVAFSNANLKGATALATATLSGVTWTSTLCPDGSQSANNGNTCLGHLLP
jgi:hypothetical protein